MLLNAKWALAICHTQKCAKAWQELAFTHVHGRGCAWVCIYACAWVCTVINFGANKITVTGGQVVLPTVLALNITSASPKCCLACPAGAPRARPNNLLRQGYARAGPLITFVFAAGVQHRQASRMNRLLTTCVVLQVYSVSGDKPGKDYLIWVQVDPGVNVLTVGLGPGALPRCSNASSAVKSSRDMASMLCTEARVADTKCPPSCTYNEVSRWCTQSARSDGCDWQTARPAEGHTPAYALVMGSVRKGLLMMKWHTQHAFSMVTSCMLKR